jgi:hypothetical protein
VVPTGSSLTYKIANYWCDFSLVAEKDFASLISTPIIGGLVKVYILHSNIIIEGTSKGEKVILYSSNGARLQSVKSQGGCMVIPVKFDGIYLVKTDNKISKVIL